jgi:hypothetical protein
MGSLTSTIETDSQLDEHLLGRLRGIAERVSAVNPVPFVGDVADNLGSRW